MSELSAFLKELHEHVAPENSEQRLQIGASTSKRIYGLDATRAILLLGGPLVHSVFSSYSTPLLQLAVQTSHLFRMSAFFMIAAYLAALNTKSSQPRWLIGRMQQLLISLATMCVIMELVGQWAKVYHPSLSLTPPLIPLHLWFLVALAAVSPITGMLDRSLRAQGFVTFVGCRPVVLLGLALCTSLLFTVLARSLRDTSFSSLTFVNLWLPVLLVDAPKHAVFYLLGYTVARSAYFRRFVFDPKFVATGIASLAASLLIYSLSGGDSFLNSAASPLKVVVLIIFECTKILMGLTILSLALRCSRAPTLLLWLSKASYTIYLLHFPFIILISYSIINIYPSINSYILFFTCFALSLGLSCGAYALMSHSQIAMFLFNGKQIRLGKATKLPFVGKLLKSRDLTTA
ncbi:Peptidoglycan/LPS O-acetylase OafA/YrhL, contains acyltransferase and SGNH-hydrolase domains [Sphingomonas palmae]|uniref:Peptidoglycan/LPS O-acetylase OafA/YrhL, contains acyltransferase and SGNH-hydrolase domains n=1 Tax=Sphingomonas palmae TaxID=1855283 RepID=A0A1H7UXX7_9SPHN|nr:acyltransferase family protein [Sphingomonas palmae]SEM01505.1 Peptidoglycan/LPS O-acetylase OafA/YrhL, contains acyltransferase and SGNH-hydrolase domains [Sphingomonas palmae]